MSHDLARPAASAREPDWIDTPDTLRRAAERWHQAAVLAVDTEFVRERTFYPGLGLLQVNDGRTCSLIDPLHLDLEPLLEVLRDETVLKVLHSCSEDMEVLWNRFRELPWPIFDTQIAAAFVGLGPAVSYRGLVEELCGVDVPKDETRTNWLRRPLRPAQLRYAALDVAHLLSCHAALSQELCRRGREAWARAEMERLRSTERFEVDPDLAYLKIKQSRSLPPRQLAVLRELAAWREREARRRNLPRNFVVTEAALPQIARLLPRDVRQLANVKVLKGEHARRHGRKLVEIVRRGLAVPQAELPPKPQPPLDLTPYRGKVDELRRVVAETATELDLPAELLATRKTVEQIVRRAVGGESDPLAPEIEGWRREAVGERLRRIFEAGL